MRRLVNTRRAIQEEARKKDGIYRGRLAEDYDGIGQYVLVALAGSSTSSAYKARVAAGDFGGGRVIPRGSPVSVASHRGNLEVFLGNQPSTDIDNFNNREIDCAGNTLSAVPEELWGQASSGRFWRATGGGVNDYYCVADGAGRWTVNFPTSTTGEWSAELTDWDPPNDQAWFPQQLVNPGSLYVKFRSNTVGSPVIGGGVTTELHLRLDVPTNSIGWEAIVAMYNGPTPAGFRGRLELQSSGVIPPTAEIAKEDWVENEWYILEVHQEDQTLSGRVYLEADGAPDYQVSVDLATALPWEYVEDDGDTLTWEGNASNFEEQVIVETDRIWFR